MAKTIRVKATWEARPYQKPLWQFFRGGGNRAVAVWHRRAGKDATAIEITKEMAVGRVGTYWHMLPTLQQARRVVWDGIDRSGNRVLDHFPGWRNPGTQLVKHLRNDEMKLELQNGSIWQLVGSDNYNSLVGSNPVGVVLSEWSLTDPAAWDFIRPILAENGGWALFIYTPRGRNHGYVTYETARKNDNWFCEVLTVEDTAAIPLEAVDQERKDGMAEEMVQQEFYCSFDAPLVGSYYGEQMADAQRDGRIGNVPHDRMVGVETWWDLGFNDLNTIWFVQRAGQELHAIDYLQNTGKDLAWYAMQLSSKREEYGYNYTRHLLPHDGNVTELGSGKTRKETLEALGYECDVVPKTGLQDGIDRVRGVLPRFWFDEEKCANGIEALRSYTKVWDDKKKIYGDKPLHNWASHGADSIRTGVMYNIEEDPNWEPIKFPVNQAIV